MTAPSLLDELEGVMRLMEAATPGEWFSQVSDPAEGVDCFWLMSLQASKALTEEVGSVNGSQWDDTKRANAELIARAVNFIRTHHAEIADMAKRLEEVERDVADYLELLAQAQDELCCFHRGMLHETSFDEVQSKRVVRTINRIEPVLKKRAATQEGEE